jgi:hypothetical protein
MAAAAQKVCSAHALAEPPNWSATDTARRDTCCMGEQGVKTASVVWCRIERCVSLLFVAAIVVTGCAGGTADTSTSATRSVAATAPVAVDLSTRELRAMMPAKADFRRLFEPTDDIWEPLFEALDNRRELRDSVLADVDPIDLERAGRTSGYLGGFWNACGGLCRPGLVDLQTEVHAFDTAGEASRFLASEVQAYRELAGKRLSDFARNQTVDTFDPGDIGNESVGLHAKTVLLKESGFFSDTVVMLRIGPIIGLSRTSRYLQEDTSSRAVALAKLLTKRVFSVSANSSAG